MKLKAYLTKIKPPYNVVEVARLGVEIPEELLDPITSNVMNFPVTLHGRTLDFDTLDMLDVNEAGKRLSPFDRRPFTIDDVSPDEATYKKIKAKIDQAISLRKRFIKNLCVRAKGIDIEHLEAVLERNPNVDINEDFKDGYTALHYACEYAQEVAAKILIKHGARLDLSISSNTPTPFELIKRKDAKMAEKLKDYLIKLLTEKMDRCDSAAVFQYAQLLINGVVLTKNVNEAIEYLQVASELGSEQADILLGDIYTNGLYGTNINFDLAKNFYEKAIVDSKSTTAKVKKMILDLLKGEIEAVDLPMPELLEMANGFNPEAQYVCSVLYKKGIGNYTNIMVEMPISSSLTVRFPVIVPDGYELSPSEYKCRKYLKYAADAKLPIAMYDYFMLIQDTDPKQSLKYLEEAAFAGLTIAQWSYAICCETGKIGAPVNLAKAAKYYKLVADCGSKFAQFKYALFCLDGKVIKPNKAVACKYFKMSADQGMTDAQFNYALLIKHENKACAAEYAKRAADSGHVPAQFMYAEMCSDTDTDEIWSPNQAELYYKKVIDDQSGEYLELVKLALYEYGFIMLNKPQPEPIEPIFSFYFARSRVLSDDSSDPQKIGAASLKKSADMDFGPAQYSYANCCVSGVGVDKDIHEAAKYYQMASENGVNQAKDALQRLQPELNRKYHSDLSICRNAMTQALYNANSQPLYQAMLESIKSYRTTDFGASMDDFNLGMEFHRVITQVFNDRSPSTSTARQVLLDRGDNPIYCRIELNLSKELIQEIIAGHADALNSTRAFINTYIRFSTTQTFQPLQTPLLPSVSPSSFQSTHLKPM